MRCRSLWVPWVGPALLLAFVPGASAQSVGCTREDFAAAVDQAAAGLRALNHERRPEFQARLRALRQKRGWSQEQFITEAAPFVRDTEIEAFEARSDEALSKVTEMGQEGAQAKSPDCRLLAELRSYMQALVEIQSAKWTYMFQKIDTELAKP
jgi:transcriptional regulator with XRE-family HTH domain